MQGFIGGTTGLRVQVIGGKLYRRYDDWCFGPFQIRVDYSGYDHSRRNKYTRMVRVLPGCFALWNQGEPATIGRYTLPSNLLDELAACLPQSAVMRNQNFLTLRSVQQGPDGRVILGRVDQAKAKAFLVYAIVRLVEETLFKVLFVPDTAPAQFKTDWKRGQKRFSFPLGNLSFTAFGGRRQKGRDGRPIRILDFGLVCHQSDGTELFCASGLEAVRRTGEDGDFWALTESGHDNLFAALPVESGFLGPETRWALEDQGDREDPGHDRHHLYMALLDRVESSLAENL